MDNSRVMTAKKTIKRGSFTYSLMGTEKIPSHIHVNNHVTNKSSVIFL